ncbi:MAG: hypothetical protein RLN99_13470, partial [Kiloniellaceae bacterium]
MTKLAVFPEPPIRLSSPQETRNGLPKRSISGIRSVAGSMQGRRIVILTGAGISKESGLDTFRDPD